MGGKDRHVIWEEDGYCLPQAVQMDKCASPCRTWSVSIEIEPEEMSFFAMNGFSLREMGHLISLRAARGNNISALLHCYNMYNVCASQRYYDI